MKKTFQKLLITILIISFFSPLFCHKTRSVSNVTVHLFWSTTCPHCHKASTFLESYTANDPNSSLKIYEISNRDNLILLEKVLSKLNRNYQGVPTIIIGNQVVIGYGSDETTGVEIESIIKNAQEYGCSDIVYQVQGEINSTPLPTSTPTPTWTTPTPTLIPSKTIQKTETAPTPLPTEVLPEDTFTQAPTEESTRILSPTEQITKDKKECDEDTNKSSDKIIEVPVLGRINTSSMSLPVLTAILGLLDGFNPCAMWALLFLISLLLGMKDRARMWILGTAFILTSAFVYFLFMSAWLNFFMFLGYVSWIQKGIGLFAITVGVYNLYDGFKNRGGGCKGSQIEKKKKVFSKIKEIVLKRNFILSLVGIIILAFAVNMVELLCSAGLPAIYTQVLSMSKLSTLEYYLYMLLYILFFMIDDLFVFFTAMITLRSMGIENKYALVSRLIGGVLILVIGLLLVLKPEWLSFS